MPQEDQGRRAIRWLVAVAGIALAVFVALTIIVTTGPPHAFDASAFRIVDDLRAPWLDRLARIVTTLGLIVIVAPAVLLAAVLLIRRRHHGRAVALLLGLALAWISVWIVKLAVDRARPPGSLVHTSGQSFPSGHAANSIGWLALAIALTAVISTRAGRIAAVLAGALVAALVGLSRIYLRAHYGTDVIAGEALAVAMYSLAAIGVLAFQARRAAAAGRPSRHQGRSAAAPADSS